MSISIHTQLFLHYARSTRAKGNSARDSNLLIESNDKIVERFSDDLEKFGVLRLGRGDVEVPGHPLRHGAQDSAVVHRLYGA